jgi:hypothetical protein
VSTGRILPRTVLSHLSLLKNSSRWSKRSDGQLTTNSCYASTLRFSRRRPKKMVDSWRPIIGAQPHLAKWFLAPNGKPDDDYKAAVKGASFSGLEMLHPK